MTTQETLNQVYIQFPLITTELYSKNKMQHKVMAKDWITLYEVKLNQAIICIKNCV